MRRVGISHLSAIIVLALPVAACQVDGVGYGAKHLKPLKPGIKAKMAEKGMDSYDPILVRIFKQESELEVWKRANSGRYKLLKTYPICKWSGKLGPKLKEGDRQAPEGFYTIAPRQMNPRSSYHLAFNMGFPNSYDRSHGRTGSHLMVHGACSSRGCYAMNDPEIEEIYSLARESFRGGQRTFQVQAYPFRMTPENMVRHKNDKNMPFWRMLKVGSDHFELTGKPPKVDVCEKRYVFNAQFTNANRAPRANGRCPDYEVPMPIARAVAAKEQSDQQAMRVIIAKMEEDKRIAAEKAKEEAEAAKRAAERKKKREEIIANVFGSDDEKETEKPDADAAAAEADAAKSETAEKADGETETEKAAAKPDGEPEPSAEPAAAPEKEEKSMASTVLDSVTSLFSGSEETAPKKQPTTAPDSSK